MFIFFVFVKSVCFFLMSRPRVCSFGFTFSFVKNQLCLRKQKHPQVKALRKNNGASLPHHASEITETQAIHTKDAAVGHGSRSSVWLGGPRKTRSWSSNRATNDTHMRGIVVSLKNSSPTAGG